MATPSTPPPRARLSFQRAAEHAVRRVPVATPETRAETIRQSLTGLPLDCATHVVVCEQQRFVGILRLEDLLAAPADARARDLMDADAPYVGPGVDQEIAAWQAVRHREAALAVVDAQGRFLGLIPPHRLLEVLLAEHEEDLARLGGLLAHSSLARSATEETALRRFWHRVPWLLVGLAGAVLAADIVGSFAEKLRANVMLAFFIPGIVYLADAVGTQTETVVVRGLSLGVRLRQMFAREIVVGLLIGLALAAAAWPMLYARWGDFPLALGVSLALFAACSSATLAAMGLPWLLDRLGFDPAFGSGPLATVVQDLLSIVMYFSIVTAVAG
jgi:magnesium transporter